MDGASFRAAQAGFDNFITPTVAYNEAVYNWEEKASQMTISLQMESLEADKDNKKEKADKAKAVKEQEKVQENRRMVNNIFQGILKLRLDADNLQREKLEEKLREKERNKAKRRILP